MRITVIVSDAAHLVHAGGEVERTTRTFDAPPPPAEQGGGEVESVEAALQKWLDWCGQHDEEPEAKSGARIAIAALSQRPVMSNADWRQAFIDERAEARAERLAGALRDAREVLDVGGARHVLGVDRACALIRKIDAALEPEPPQ